MAPSPVFGDGKLHVTGEQERSVDHSPYSVESVKRCTAMERSQVHRAWCQGVVAITEEEDY